MTLLASSIKVGFVLLSNSRNPIPSTRIAILNVLPYLRSTGFDPHIVFDPEQPTDRPDVDGLAQRLIGEGFQVVVFQKVRGPSVERLVEQLGAAGIRTVFCVCDFIDEVMARCCDATVVVTDFLKSLYPAALQPKIHVVHDGIEHPELFKPHAGSSRGTFQDRLHAVLVTSVNMDKLPHIGTPPRWLKVSIVGRYFPSHHVKGRLGQLGRKLLAAPSVRTRLDLLRFSLDPNIRCVAWDPLDVYRRMLDADVGIIPVDAVDAPNPDAPVPSWKVKSENRLSMKMSLGLPVVATPIPSYEPLVRQGVNGFLAHGRSEWLDSLDALRDPRLRESMGQAARASVLQRYSMEEQARLLGLLFQRLAAGKIVSVA